MSEQTREEYEAQLQAMLVNANQWRKNNPEREAEIRWNFPSDVCIIAPISQAVKNGFVVANDAGLELMKALWSWDVSTEPSVLMTRMVIECDGPKKRV